MNEDCKEYVLGFLFDDECESVALIKKTKPSWQKGKLNGIGGKIEYSETNRIAIVREFFEETTVQTKLDDWQHFTTLEGKDFSVYAYCQKNTDLISKIKTNTEEEVIRVLVEDIKKVPTLSNVPWLVEMAIDKLNGEKFFAVATYL